MIFNWHLFFYRSLSEKNKYCIAFLQRYNFAKEKRIYCRTQIKGIDISYAYGMHDDVDFTNIERLNMSHVDLQRVTSIKFNPLAAEINLTDVRGLYGKFDFSGTNKLCLRDTDLTRVFVLKGAKNTDMCKAKGLVGYMDFATTDYLNLSGTDLSRVKYRFNLMAKKIDLSFAKGLSGVLDFGNTEHVILTGTDLTNVTKIVCGPSTVLTGIVGFVGTLEQTAGKQLGKKMSKEKSIYKHHAKNQVRKYSHIASRARRGR